MGDIYHEDEIFRDPPISFDEYMRLKKAGWNLPDYKTFLKAVGRK